MLNMMWKSNKCWKFFLLAAACLDGVNIFHADAPSSLPDSHAAYFKETHSSFRLVFLFLCFDFLILQQISKKAFGIPYLVLTISAPLRTLAPNHAGDWCSRWQLANQMVMRNMIRYIWFTWKRNDVDCDHDDGEGNVMIWHGWSIACQPLMACCDFFLDKLSNSAPFCSHFQLLQSTFICFLFFKMNWTGQFLYIL